MNERQTQQPASDQELPAFVDGLQLPPLLRTLVHDGVWPKTIAEANHQHVAPLVPLERIRGFAADESELYLYHPPFHMVATLITHGEAFWTWSMAAPTGIDPDLSICIGDFGLGSDAPIVLDYRVDALEPRVLRLRWHTNDESQNQWVEIAPTFKRFVELLGLRQSPK